MISAVRDHKGSRTGAHRCAHTQRENTRLLAVQDYKSRGSEVTSAPVSVFILPSQTGDRGAGVGVNKFTGKWRKKR